jgi:hypothetical protein
VTREPEDWTGWTGCKRQGLLLNLNILFILLILSNVRSDLVVRHQRAVARVDADRDLLLQLGHYDQRHFEAIYRNRPHG